MIPSCRTFHLLRIRSGGVIILDLSTYSWTLTGYSPTSWTMGRTLEQAIHSLPEIPQVPAKVPGSVQQALLTAGILPDWNRKLDSRSCEWVDP